MERQVAHTLHDILETIERVQTKVAGKTFEEFEADWELRFIVQRAIEIISEATRRLPAELKPGPRSNGEALLESATCCGTNITRFPTR